MVAWSSLTPDEKLAACKKAVADGAVTAEEAGQALGCGRGAVLGICRRKGADLFTNPRALKAKARRASERGRKNILKAQAKQREMAKAKQAKAMVVALDPSKRLERSRDKPAHLPCEGEGVALSQAIETGGCRYAIGEPSAGFGMEVCGKPLTPKDKARNFHFCEACQPHLINISAQTQARRAANG